MNIEQFLDAWIAAANSYDQKAYLEFYTEDSVLDDPSVGRKFEGKDGIADYFNNYFIGYQTQTRKVHLVVADELHAHLEVEFTGTFPEGRIGGTFDFIFSEGKITYVRADLITS